MNRMNAIFGIAFTGGKKKILKGQHSTGRRGWKDNLLGFFWKEKVALEFKFVIIQMN